MSFRQPFRRGLIACVLVFAAVSSAALTLGRSRGVALLGRPLDVAIPLTLDAPGQASELCPEADLFHGDTRVPAARVTARIEPGSGLNAVVRVQSSMPVDEPVVTVYLRLGCSERFTRRYVLLTEEPAELAPFGRAVTPAQVPLPLPVPSPTRSVVPAAPGAADPAATGTGTGAETTTAPRRGAAARAAERARRAEAPMTPRGGAAQAPITLRGPAVGRLESELPSAQQRAESAPRGPTRAVTRSGRPRLTVDMLDLTPERDAQLRSSGRLAGTPSTDEQVRAQAAALWRSINAQPEDVLRDLQRVQALENDVKGLRGLVAANDRTLTELRGQLTQAQQERTLTLAAIALLVLLLAATVVTWWLRRGERGGTGEWWRRGDAVSQVTPGVAAPAGAAPAPPPARAAGMDLRVDESMFESLKKPPRLPVMPSPAALARTQAVRQQPPPVPAPTPVPPAATLRPAVAGRPSGPAGHPGFQNSATASMRMVKAEELVDIQQQADFFISLGQTDQAIEVLESHIHSNAETSALVWLDLLAIYRSIKRRDDYELLRADFQRVFNAQVPPYDSTPTVSGGLEDYPRALTRIAALWPSPKVMDVIEESIFRKPGMDGAEPFDLEAYRELVMLYNLGREVVGVDAGQSGGDSLPDSFRSSFNETSMQPLSVSRHGGAEPSTPDSLPPSDLDSLLDSTPDQSATGEIVDLDSLQSMHSMIDSDVDQSLGPRTTGNEFFDPQVPRPSSRLGLDIDLTAPVEPARKPATDSGSIDFELFEPERDSNPGQLGKAG